MENRKDIGKAFRDKLSMIEKSPDAALWDRIENDLQQKQKKRRFNLTYFLVAILSVLGILTGILITENISLKGSNTILENNTYSGNETSGQVRQNQNSVASETTYSEKTNNSDKTEGEYTGEKYNSNEEEEYIGTGESKATKINKSAKVNRTTGAKAEKAIDAKKTAKSKNNYFKTKTETEKNSHRKKLANNSDPATSNNSIEKNTFSKANHERKTALRRQKQGNLSKNKSKSGQNNSLNTDKQHNTAITKTKNNGFNNNETDFQIAQTKKNNTSGNNQLLKSDNQISAANSEISTNTGNDSIANNIVTACIEETDSLQNQKKENKNPLKEQDKKEDDKKGKAKINIIASVFYAPTISGSLTGKSLINDSFNDYSIKKTMTNSYGAYLGIKHKKLGIRVGYVKVDLENSVSINNSQGTPISDYSNILLSGGITPATINNHFSSSDNVTIVQKASYANIPLEFKHTVFSKSQFGIDAIGGVSVILLGKTNLEMYGNNASKITIGKTDNASKMNLGLNLGIGLNYNLTKNLQLDINPILTYLHNVGNSNFKPYSLLLQSGFSYRF